MAELTVPDLDLVLDFYRGTLGELARRYTAGEKGLVGSVAEIGSDALRELKKDAPANRRHDVEKLIQLFDALRVRCLN